MKKIRFIPDIQRVLVQQDEQGNEKTRGGIIIPSAVKDDKPAFGTILEVGTGEKDIPMRYKVGDRVMFSSYAGIEVTLDYSNPDKKVLKVMNQMDIMGKIIEIEE